jgi:hypothetical protein
MEEGGLTAAGFRRDKASNAIGLTDLTTIIKKIKKSLQPAEISSPI